MIEAKIVEAIAKAFSIRFDVNKWLSRPDRRWQRRVQEVCPHATIVQTGVDASPGWTHVGFITMMTPVTDTMSACAWCGIVLPRNDDLEAARVYGFKEDPQFLADRWTALGLIHERRTGLPKLIRKIWRRRGR